MPPRIAVFTKNRTNPAYEAARIGADRAAMRLGAATSHYVPEQPDNVPEQIALIERAIAQRPDAACSFPVHETAVNDAILGFDAARIPLFNFVTRTTAGQRVCFVGSDDRALATGIARHLFAKLSGRGEIVIVEGTPASATSRERLDGFHAALARLPGHQGPGCRCAATTSATSLAPPLRARPTSCRASTRSCAPTTSWRWACWMRSRRPAIAIGRWWSASTQFPRRSRRLQPDGCWPRRISTPWR